MTLVLQQLVMFIVVFHFALRLFFFTPLPLIQRSGVKAWAFWGLRVGLHETGLLVRSFGLVVVGFLLAWYVSSADMEADVIALIQALPACTHHVSAGGE